MRRVKSTSKLVVLMTTMLFLLVFSMTAQADTVKGRIKIIDGTYLIVTKNQIAYTLAFTSSVSEQQVKRLGNGDFVSVTADFSSTSRSLINVSSVDYVGLKIILGTWRSEANLCYEFATFTRLYVFSPDTNDKCLRGNDPDEFDKYNYFINPDTGAWNMLLSNSDSEFFAELKLTSDTKIEIELFDAQSDANLGTLVLRR